MRVNLINMLTQCADTIEHRKRDEGAYAYALGELVGHLRDVRSGKNTWAEFAEAYCLLPSDATQTGCNP